MYDNDQKGLSYMGGFFMLIGFAIAGLFLASVINISVWQSMTGTGIKTIEEGMKNPVNADAVKLMQVINAVVGFLIPALVTAAVLHRRPLKLLGFAGRITGKQVLVVIGLVIAAVLVSSGLSYFNMHAPLPESWKVMADKMESSYNEQVVAIINLTNASQFILALLVMALLPAVCEEAVFRGGLQNYLARGTRSPWLAIIVVSIIFSVAHFSFYGFLARFFLGLVLGLIYQYSGRLWLSILAHFINNAAAITFIYLRMRGEGVSLREIIDDKSGNYYGVFALPVVILLSIVLKKISAKRLYS